MYFLCVGIWHKTGDETASGPIISRDVAAEARDFLRSLVREGTIQEGFFLYTKTFAEFYAVSDVTDEVHARLDERILDFLASRTDAGYDVSHFHRQETIAHFLRITGGLDVMPLGEPFILEEVKESFTASLENDCTGPMLNRLFQLGLETGYAIRKKTRISQGAVLLEEAIAELAEKIIESVADKSALVIGHNRAAQNAGAALTRKRIGRLAFTGPSYSDSERLSLRYGGKPVLWEQRNTALDQYDLIVVADKFTANVLEFEDMEPAVRARSRRPLIIFDCFGPGAFAPNVKKIANLFYYEREQIDSLIRYNLEERRREIPQAEKIIRESNEAYHKWLYSDQRYIFKDIVAKSRPMQKVLEMVQRIADSDITVLIQGPTGTGKEIIANAIHKSSKRAKKPFIVVNCGAIPDTLLESELFGHAKGSFTGAITNKTGLFEEAHGGTIFLDEIGDTTPAIHVKLLRVLQEREILPIGKTTPVKVDVRVIAATNQNLQELVEKGKFRQDLYFRLNVIQLSLSPLAGRRDDIIPLAHYFIKKFCNATGKTVYELSSEAEKLLQNYAWPGNVRELENAMERAVALTLGFQITPTDLPLNIQQYRPKAGEPPVDTRKARTLRDIEREHIAVSLAEHDWNYSLVAETLGIGRTTLWRKMKRYGIKPPAGSAEPDTDPDENGDDVDDD